MNVKQALVAVLVGMVCSPAGAVTPYLAGAVGNTDYGVAGVDSGLALRLAVGLRYSPYLSAEAGFIEMGAGDLKGGGELRVVGFELGGQGFIPMGSRSHMLVRGGFLVWEFADDSVQVVDQDGNTDLFLGLGLRYEYSERLFLFTDYTQYFLEFDEDPQVWGVGAGTHF